MEVSINGWYPSIIHFRKIFHHNQRAVGVAPWLWKPPKDGCHAIATKSQNAGSAGVISLGESMWKPKIHQNTKSGWWCNTHLEKYEFVNGKDDIPYEMEKTSLKPPTRSGCFILCHLGTAQEKVRSQSPHVIPPPRWRPLPQSGWFSNFTPDTQHLPDKTIEDLVQNQHSSQKLQTFWLYAMV